MTWLLVCDFCDDRTRLPTDHHELNRFLYEWKLVHHGHVYLDRRGAFDNPPMTDPFNASPAPCDDETLSAATP
jgi:hypothetical protein